MPQSEITSHVDEIEAFMYQKMFVYLQDFADRNSKVKNEIQMPIPLSKQHQFYLLTFLHC